MIDASESVQTDTSAVLQSTCAECSAPIDLSTRRRIRTRRFCSTGCRTHWHRHHREALQAEAADLLRRCAAIIEELAGPKR
jgi:RNA polymerase-binding transcription factor DksA